MGLVPCKECKKVVAKSAKSCPHCGVSQPGVTAADKAGGCLVVILVAIGLGWWIVHPSDTTATTEADAMGATQSITVTASELGDAWPLTSSSARLYCNPMGERYLTVDSTNYALNGKALRAGMPRPDAVLKEGAIATVLIERAGALCGSDK